MSDEIIINSVWGFVTLTTNILTWYRARKTRRNDSIYELNGKRLSWRDYSALQARVGSIEERLGVIEVTHEEIGRRLDAIDGMLGRQAQMLREMNMRLIRLSPSGA